MALLKKQSTDKFIELMVESTPFLKLISFVQLNEPVCSYPLVTLARYKTRGVSRTQVAALQNVGETMINFSTKELVIPLVIPDSYIEDMNSNHTKVADYVAKVFAQDLQYLFLNGDTEEKGTTDEALLRKVMDGVTTQLIAASKEVDYAEDATNLEKINTLVSALPDTALADPNLKVLIGSSAYTELWNEIAGDSVAKSLYLVNGVIKVRGKIEVIEVPELSKIIVINPAHIAGGICRDINIEVQRYPEARGNKVVGSCRVDLQVVPDFAVIEGTYRG